MTLTITPTRLKGAVTPPPSKSQAHRVLIAAALAEGDSVIENVSDSQDMEATLRCLEELGASWEREGQTLTVHGMGAGPMSPLMRMAHPRLDCGESGSTLRFLIPVALALRGGGVFTGHGRLMERPQGPYFDIFREKGIFFEQKDGVLTLQGQLTPGEYRLPGNVSSQFITGLLFALPLLEGDSTIVPTTALESRDYIRMTVEALSAAGVAVEEPREGRPYFSIRGGQRYRPGRFTVEADWSQAGFWYAAAFLGNQVDIKNISFQSTQGDRVVASQAALLQQAGEKEIDVSGCPDLVPPLAVMAALRAGQVTRLTNAGRLRIKESDRLAAVTSELCKLGAKMEEGPDFLTITGVDHLTGGEVEAHNDHRIAMMLAVAATRAEGPVVLSGAESVKKSYPNFWGDYVNLGGTIQGA